MTKNEIEQMVNTISGYEKRLFDSYLEIENLTRDFSNAFERLKSQQREIDRLETENEQLKADIKEFEIEVSRRALK